MDLRHNQLPWSEQIWAKINADLAQALRSRDACGRRLKCFMCRVLRRR